MVKISAAARQGGARRKVKRDGGGCPALVPLCLAVLICKTGATAIGYTSQDCKGLRTAPGAW